MTFANKRAIRARYPAELKSILSVAKAEESRRWLATWSGIEPGPTPLYALKGLAESLGLAQILLKDESVRSDLGSFKALGAPIALIHLIRRLCRTKGWTRSIFSPGHMRRYCAISPSLAPRMATTAKAWPPQREAWVVAA